MLVCEFTLLLRVFVHFDAAFSVDRRVKYFVEQRLKTRRNIRRRIWLGKSKILVDGESFSIQIMYT